MGTPLLQSWGIKGGVDTHAWWMDISPGHYFPLPFGKCRRGNVWHSHPLPFFLPFLPSLLQLLLNTCCTHMHFFLSLLKEVYKLPLWVRAQLSRQRFLVYFKPQVWHRAFSDFVAVWKLSHKDQRRSYSVTNVGGDQMYLVPWVVASMRLWLLSTGVEDPALHVGGKAFGFGSGVDTVDSDYYTVMIQQKHFAVTVPVMWLNVIAGQLLLCEIYVVRQNCW